MRNPMKCNYKIRFHHGRGKNYMHWRIEDMEIEDAIFFDPKKYNLIIYGAFLRNQPAAAKKIYEGGHKTVCAWIECEGYVRVPATINPPIDTKVSYNPKNAPNWLFNGSEGDGMAFDDLVTLGNGVYTPKQELFNEYLVECIKALKESIVSSF